MAVGSLRILGSSDVLAGLQAVVVTFAEPHSGSGQSDPSAVSALFLGSQKGYQSVQAAPA